jgi:hypothetical protein
MKRLHNLVGNILGDIKHKHTHKFNHCKCILTEDQLNNIKVKVTVHLQELAKQLHTEVMTKTEQLDSTCDKQISDVDALTSSINSIVRDIHWDMLTSIDDIVHPK